jgi:hypothetical protein
MKKLPKFNDYVSDTLPVLCSSGPVTSFYRWDKTEAHREYVTWSRSFS